MTNEEVILQRLDRIEAQLTQIFKPPEVLKNFGKGLFP